MPHRKETNSFLEINTYFFKIFYDFDAILFSASKYRKPTYSLKGKKISEILSLAFEIFCGLIKIILLKNTANSTKNKDIFILSVILVN